MARGQARHPVTATPAWPAVDEQEFLARGSAIQYNGGMDAPQPRRGQFRLRSLLLAFVPVAVIALMVGRYLRLPKRIPVSGIITQRGQPLYSVQVSFVPVDRNGHAAYATTDPRGKFTLEDGVSSCFGAMPGNYIVTVSTSKKKWPKRPHIPDRYTDDATSPLTAEVTVDGPNSFAFDLASQ